MTGWKVASAHASVAGAGPAYRAAAFGAGFRSSLQVEFAKCHQRALRVARLGAQEPGAAAAQRPAAAHTSQASPG